MGADYNDIKDKFAAKPCDFNLNADCAEARACQICGKSKCYCEWLECSERGCPQKWWGEPLVINLRSVL